MEESMAKAKTTPGGIASNSLAEVIRKAKGVGALVVDVRFTDLIGSTQHFSVPMSEFTADLAEEGPGF